MEFSPRDQFCGFLATPQILAKNSSSEYPLYPTRASIIEEGLSEISEPSATVLGKRMEEFFGSYVHLFTSEEVVAQNEQIISNKQTLGELDFLLKNTASGEVSHVELIYKFYLFDPGTGTSEREHLIGPNRRDSFIKKVDRLKQKQFPLLFLPATQNLLNRLQISPESVIQKMCFKAAVFLPKQMKKTTFSDINSEAVAGYWIRASEFNVEAYGANTFYTPKKKYWPVLPHRNSKWFSFEDIKVQINRLLTKEFSPLVWMKTPQGNVERFFVVWW